MEKKETKSALQFDVKLSEETQKRILKAIEGIPLLPVEATGGAKYNPTTPEWVDVYPK